MLKETKEPAITVLIFEVGELPRVATVPNTLEALQAIVGGYIECFPVGVAGTVGVCNEEGLNIGLPFNRPIGATHGGIFGDFFVAGDTGDHFRSLTAEEIERVIDELA